jgi:putative FmdB family regulatory protein
MPTYDYECQAEECKHTFEADQSIKEDPIKICPKCGKPEVKRLISGGTGFQLVGSCWAKDNYK